MQCAALIEIPRNSGRKKRFTAEHARLLERSILHAERLSIEMSRTASDITRHREKLDIHEISFFFFCKIRRSKIFTVIDAVPMDFRYRA